ncbi:MAG: DNA-binding protein [Acetobacteraceae bacterium]|nr:MAG: DNA-binding protein [Acetobacteraceae bacterium]
MTTLSQVDGVIAGRGLPVVDIDNAPFFEAAARGELVIQRCKETGQYQYYPRAGSVYTMGEIEWVKVAGKGKVYSYTIIRKNPADPAWAPLVPYAVVMVELPEGVRIFGNLTGCEAEDVTIGMNVEVYFTAANEDGTIHLPCWKPAT